MNQSSLSQPTIAGERRLPAGWGASRFLFKHGLGLIITTFIILGLLYDVTVPFFEKPDELKHFALIQYLQSRHRLPLVEAGLYKPWDQEGTQPPLYHILAAAAVSWLDLSDFAEPARNPHYADERSFVWRERGNNNLYLHAPGENWSIAPVFVAARLARWLSLLAGAGTIGLTYLLALLVFSEDTAEEANLRPPSAHSLALLAAALVAFIPQFLHVSSAITNDSLTVTLAAATLVILALIIKKGGSMRYALYLGLALGLGAITKLSLLYLGPLAGLVLLLDLRRHGSARRLLAFGAATGGLLLLLAGWWYWRNWQLYADPTALSAHLLYRGGPLNPRPTLARIWRTEMVGLELSFWAAFGAGQILLEPWLYAGLRWVKYIVLAGLLLGVWRIVSDWSAAASKAGPEHGQNVAGVEAGGGMRSWSFRAKLPPSVLGFTRYVLNTPHLLILALLALWTLTIFLALLRWMQITPASWGRLLYPALPALGVLAAWGLAQFPLHGRRATVQASSKQALSLVLPSALAAGLLLLSLSGPLYYINIAYAKTPLMTAANLPAAGVERLGFVYDDALRLLGYRLEKRSLQPGEWLPVTLYWQATRPLAKNYSVFVHLLDGAGQAIGQANTYPGGGKWPTSMLEPGAVLEDTYYVWVPPGTKAPMVMRLALGIFEFDDPARAAKTARNASGDVVEPIVGAIPLLPRQWPQLKPRQPLAANFGGQIKLVGYDWPAAQKIEPGAVLPLTLYWEPLGPPGQNLNLFIHLIDPVTQTQLAGFDGPPDFPTAFWQPGQALIDARSIALPADLPPGDYRLDIGWYNLDDSGRLPLEEENEASDTLALLTFSVE